MDSRAIIIKNLISLFGVQFVMLALPLLTLPFLSRVLQPEAWGQLAAVQSLAITLSLIVEYGFAYSATRTVAAQRDQPEAIARLAHQVLSAKLALSVIVLLVGALVFVLVPGFREHPLLFVLGLVYAVVQGFAPLWYFQGVESLQRVAIIDIASRVTVTFLILFLIRRPEHVLLVLVFQILGVVGANFLNTLGLYQRVRYVAPSFAAARTGIREGWSMFLFRGAIGMYTSINAALLRGFLPSAAVAQYANADRLANALKSLVQPVTQALFPRISHLTHHHPEAARSLARRSLIALVSFSSIAAVCAYLIAPTFIPWFLGSGYNNSVHLFQLLSLTIPLVTASGVLGVQWMLPNRMDKAFNLIIAMAGVINISMAFVLIPRLQATGMAYAVISSEIFVTASMALYLGVKGVGFMGRAEKTV